MYTFMADTVLYITVSSDSCFEDVSDMSRSLAVFFHDVWKFDTQAAIWSEVSQNAFLHACMK